MYGQNPSSATATPPPASAPQSGQGNSKGRTAKKGVNKMALYAAGIIIVSISTNSPG